MRKYVFDNAVTMQYICSHGGASMPRYTIDYDNTFDKTLTDLMKDTGATTKADVIRRAVAAYKYFKSQGSDAKISVTKDGKVVNDVVLP
jgi:hypothetical protein